MEESAAGLKPSDKKPEPNPGMGRRISHLIMNKFGVLAPKSSKSADGAGSGSGSAVTPKKAGVAQRLSVMVMSMAKSGKNKQEAREHKYATGSAGLGSDKPSKVIKSSDVAKRKKTDGAKKHGVVKRMSIMLGINKNRNKVSPAFTNIGDEGSDDE